MHVWIVCTYRERMRIVKMCDDFELCVSQHVALINGTLDIERSKRSVWPRQRQRYEYDYAYQNQFCLRKYLFRFDSGPMQDEKLIKRQKNAFSSVNIKILN